MKKTVVSLLSAIPGLSNLLGSGNQTQPTEPEKPKVTIVGTAICRFGGLVHQHDGDEMRANRLSDGGVFCVFCGTRGPSTFDALLSACGSGGRCQLVAVDNPHRYEYTITLAPNAWASICFDNAGQFNGDVTDDFGTTYKSPKPEAKLPECIDRLATALTRIGFRVTGDRANNTSGSLIMILGRRLFPGDPDRPAVDGVKVELTWLY